MVINKKINYIKHKFNLFIYKVAGNIIDTFKSLKVELAEKDEDEKNKCFICGLDRELLDKSTEIAHGFI
jgi:hypothetical protein